MPNQDEDREEQLILLAALLAWFKAQSKKLAEALRGEVITLAAWLVGMRLLIKRLHTSAALIAGEVDEALVAARIAEQYGYLGGFAGAIQDGDEGEELSVAAIIARAASYAGAGGATFWLTVIEQEKSAGKTEVLWVVNHALENCPDCLDWESMGWMPVDELTTAPREGDTQCLMNCGCDLLFR